MKEMYIFSRAFLLILNFSTRSKLSLCHAVLVMLYMCSVQLQLFASVNPKCLCDDVFLRFVIVALPGLFSYLFCDCGTPCPGLFSYLFIVVLSGSYLAL